MCFSITSLLWAHVAHLPWTWSFWARTCMQPCNATSVFLYACSNVNASVLIYVCTTCPWIEINVWSIFACVHDVCVQMNESVCMQICIDVICKCQPKYASKMMPWQAWEAHKRRTPILCPRVRELLHYRISLFTSTVDQSSRVAQVIEKSFPQSKTQEIKMIIDSLYRCGC